jgi:hypothetical protein
MLLLTIPIYQPGTGGAPSTSILLAEIGQRIDSYQHSITATVGFESMSVTFVASIEESLTMLTTWLMASTTVYGPDGETLWEGALIGITAQLGSRSRSINLDGMANRMRVRYTTVLSTPGTTAQVSDATSVARYGTKDGVVSVGTTTATIAATLANAELAARKNPLAQPSTAIKTGSLGGVQITLQFVGWYDMLKWVMTSSTSTNTTSTTTQVQGLITSYNTVNNFFSSDYSRITASGVSDTETINNDTPYKEKIETLLKLGNSSNQRLAWGVYENRQFVVNQWAGATPTTIAYMGRFGEAVIYDGSGNTIDPWNVRPDAMYQEVDLLDVSPLNSATDTASTFYIERVTCSISQHDVNLSLEPAASTAIDSMIAILK